MRSSDDGEPAHRRPDGPGRPRFVVSDPHGHLDLLVEALHDAGLTTPAGAWAGADARLWFLGDFFDRGPDGVGVLELVRRLAGEASRSRGEVRALLGNHEILALGMRRFGTTAVPHQGIGLRTFERSWVLNGGRDADQQRLTEDHITWLLSLPMVALDGDYLLLHSDNLEYLRWGDTIDEINATAHAQMRSDDITVWWEMWRRMTVRYAFRGQDGPSAAREVLRRLGGRRIVHGHSIIADMLGVEPAAVTGPVLYADDLVLAVDAGTYDGGPSLVVELPPLPPLP
jgi:hypothetical protein